MSKLTTFLFLAFSLNLWPDTNNKSPLAGAWWFVNSNTVSLIEQVGETELISKQCEAQEYFSTQTCVEYGETKHYVLANSGNEACSLATTKHSYCWYRLQTSTTGQYRTLYIKADSRNTMPGVGYTLSAKRLTPGEWPMRN